MLKGLKSYIGKDRAWRCRCDKTFGSRRSTEIE
jgi:hypothetical protein